MKKVEHYVCELCRTEYSEKENEKYNAKAGYGETMIVNSFLDVDISNLLLPGVVIYKFPEDMSNYEYVCRLREITKDLPTNIVIVRNSLEECRKDIMIAFPFMTVFPRDKRDLPTIVETWF